MVRCVLPSHLRRAAQVAAVVAAGLAGTTAPASASCSWFTWFGQDRPVVYRPVVTPTTYYFSPASAAEVLPAPRHRPAPHHRHRVRPVHR